MNAVPSTRLSCRLLTRQTIIRAGSSQSSCSRTEPSSRLYSAASHSLSERRQHRSFFQRIPCKVTSARLIHASAYFNAQANRLVDYLLADVGEGITECEIIKWYVEPGSTVEEFDVLVEVQSDKASVEITSRYAGIVKEHCYKVGEVAKVGSALCKIQVQSEEEEASSSEQQPAERVTIKDESSSPPLGETSEPAMSGQGDSLQDTSSSSTGDQKGAILATPAVRRMIREHGIEISKVKGTGKSGRVTKEDIQIYMTASPEVSSKETIKQQGGQTSVKSLTGTRKAMFKAMSATWNIPHFGYSDEIDVTKLDQIRKEMQSKAGKDTVKLTLLPFLIKALSMALDQHPIFRSTLDEAAMSLHEKEEHRISIALSSSRGLLTPTLAHDVRQLSVPDIAEQVQSLQRISVERGLTQKEMASGATVTLSNIGNIGGLFTFPLIPPTGQLIIGAVGRSRIMPRFDENGDLIKALILPASFSADHRVVEGVELAQFVQDWKNLVENPTTWLLRLT